jgi:hypothetical protein
MDSAQHCRDQAGESACLMHSVANKDHARLLGNIAASWTRLAGQIDRYNALLRQQREQRTAQQVSLNVSAAG